MLKRKLITIAVAMTLLVGLLAAGAAPAAAAGYALPEDTVLYAPAAILVNLAGNPAQDMVIYEKEADTVHAPGSMMRYAVLAYALQRAQEQGLDIDTATGTYTKDLFNRYVAGTGVPTANMKFGEVWTLRDLMAVSFMQSASDAVTVLAQAIDGSVTGFVDGMNAMAEQLGCDYTHFANLTGLDSLSQYTTARDMYRIVRYCQSFSLFEDLASPPEVTVTPVKGGNKRTIATNNHLEIASSSYYYEPLLYSRTGLSEHEGRTCASVARDAGYEYLVVVLGCAEKNDKGEERWLKTQENFKKRLDRQERSHRKQVSALEAQIAELKKQLEGKKPELQREDFPSESAWNKYREEELKREILAENDKRQAAAEEASRRNAAAHKKLDDTFKTPEAKREFQETLSDFIEDNGEWLESEEGQLYQEIIDQSPVGLVMAMAIAKNSEVTEQMKNWSKDLLFQKLSQFESTLLQNAKEAAKKQPSNGQPQTPTQTRPSTSGIPSTGSVGKTQAPATFNAKDWLRKNRPERYPTH